CCEANTSAGAQRGLSLVPLRVRPKVVVVIILVQDDRQTVLTRVTQGGSAFGRLFSLSKNWEKDRRQYGDDRNDNEQLYQCKAARRMFHEVLPPVDSAARSAGVNRGGPVVALATSAASR